MSNERQIGLGIIMYANDNKGHLPDDLATLFKNEDLTAQVFICPGGSTTVPAEFSTMSKDDQASYDKLSKLSGDDFDKEYLTLMVKDHHQDMKEFREESAKVTRGCIVLEKPQLIKELVMKHGAKDTTARKSAATSTPVWNAPSPENGSSRWPKLSVRKEQ